MSASPWLRYGIALASVVVATLLRLLLQPLLGDSLPFITYFIAVMFTVWLARMGPAILAAVLGGAAAIFIFIGPERQTPLVFGGREIIVRLALYLTVCATIISLGEAMYRARGRVAILASIVDSSDDAIISKTLDGTITSWNSGGERLYGYKASEVVGRPISLLIPPSQPDELPAIMNRLRRGERIEHYETVRIKKNGELVNISLTVSPMKDARGKIIGASAIARDITERVRAAEALRLSETRYRTLADAVQQLMWVNSVEGQVEFFNGRWTDYTGASSEEQKGLGWLSIIHPEDAPRIVETRTRYIRAGEPYEFECRLRRADGVYRWHLARVVPLKDTDGRVMQWMGTATDIHELKRAQEAQRFLSEVSRVLASSLDYETTLATVSHLAVPVLADWCIVELLEAGNRVRRLLPAHTDLAKAERAERLRNYAPSIEGAHPTAQVLRTGQSVLINDIDDEAVQRWTHDSEHFKLVHGLRPRALLSVPLIVRGAIFGALMMVRAESAARYEEEDLSLAEELARRCAQAIDNARLYTEAQKAQAAAEQASRLKDEFLATVSHELRTPLTAITGWALIMRSRQLDDKASARALEVIERNARAQKQIIDDLLDVSRVISGKLRLDVRALEIEPIVRAAVDAVRLAADAKQIEIQTSIHPLAREVAGDADRLQQIVWNLLSNAIKFTSAGGRVTVEVRQVEGQAEIVVSDTGQGIAPEFQPHVFERFRQADASTTRAYGGLGLGLAIVRHLVEMHGGTVSVASEGEGRGSTFTVRLPLAPPSRPEITWRMERPGDEKNFAGRSPSVMLTGLRVLVVDDDEDTLALVETMLTQAGATVLKAGSVKEALAVIESTPVDALASDIGMPVEDGYGLIRHIRAREEAGRKENGRHVRRLPAIALTAYARAEDHARALAEGFQAHVAKPIEPETLVRALVDACRETVGQ